MNYCPECGSKIEVNSSVCRYCGFVLKRSEAPNEKDKRIEELEKKIAHLEKNKTSARSLGDNDNSPWIFIMPIAVVAIFFLFIFLIVFVATSR